MSGGSSSDRPGITAREVEPVVAPEGCTPEELARDERFWTRVASRSPTTPGIVNLENGYYGIMPAPVRQAYLTNMDRLNESNSYLLRTSYKAELEDIGRKLELAAMAGAAVLDTYARALHDHPRVGLLLLSHMNNRTGLVVPVREVVAMAAQRGSGRDRRCRAFLGTTRFHHSRSGGADFVGFSLHKWINAPLGAGFLYIRRERLGDIDLAFGDEIYPADDIRSRVHSGTSDAATFLTVDTALDCHAELGASVEQARLRRLRNHWVDRVRHIDNIEILTPEDPSMYAAITSFRISGRASQGDDEAIVRYLLEKYGIFTVRRGGVDHGDCVRVTPAQFTLIEHVDRPADALPDVARRFRA
ncbi:aminotransferase class V-fold PLP-dependent enzyme [Nocardia paucivorans]|uniref:aminotransferase class V-fold PLP-dependent enzyme n=1 Tax=Nocardia paucivorans TaxID=114259 RepID=UPI0002F2C30A|nr:aminotransferase class V-fold PLP-dependent enzyme [Nocardia paucivorans]